jgi:hypothetical protein
MHRRAGIFLVAAALGAGASVGVGACGEDRGSVSVEDGGTGTAGGTETSTSPTDTTPTETSTTETGG